MSSPEGSTVTFRRVPANLERTAIERFAIRLESEVAKGRTFDCLITGDVELRRLNREFRGKDYATDVLSFPAGPEKEFDAEARRARRKTRRTTKSKPESAEGAENAGELGTRKQTHRTPRGYPDAETLRKRGEEPKSKPESAEVAEGAENAGVGDIAISVARARAQAREFGHSTEQEIQILMLHGLLHLLGLDHVTDGGQMARAEKRWRGRLGLPNGLIERVES